MLLRILLITLLLCGIAHAQSPVVLDRSEGMVPLYGRMAWLVDGGGRLQVQEAEAASGWQALAGSPNAGFTSGAVWLRFEVIQGTDVPSWRLELRNTLLEDVRFFQRDATGEWRMQVAGRNVKHSAWPLDTRSPTFRLDLPPGRHEVMLRLASRSSLSTSLRLWESERYYASSRDDAFLWGGYFGVYGLVILIQFLFWQWTRESLSGWYVPYAALNFLGVLMTMGYLQNALDWNSDLATPVLGISICAVVFVSTRFSSVLLELDQVMPRLNRFLLWGAAAVSVVTSLLVLAGEYAAGVGTSQIVSMAWILLLSGASIVLMRRGHVAARFYLIAFGIFYLGILIRYLRNLGWLEPGIVTDYSIQVGSVLHMIVMCLFIVYRYNTLRIALRVEQAARQEQRDFVAMVSHELRTPLAIIGTSAQRLAAHLDAPVEKSLRRCANITAASRRMSDLMDNYLTVERMDSSDRSIRLRRCDISSLFKELVSEWPEDRIQLTAQALPESHACDPDMLQVAFRNLITNAIRHARTGTAIDVIVRGNRHGLTVRVVNRGENIPVEELPLLFQKYYRGRAARGMTGAGLGLFLVKKIVDAHGGRVEVQCESGVTTFKVLLPATASFD